MAPVTVTGLLLPNNRVISFVSPLLGNSSLHCFPSRQEVLGRMDPCALAAEGTG